MGYWGNHDTIRMVRLEDMGIRTYMLAHDQLLVLLPVAIALGSFPFLSLSIATGPPWIAVCLGTTVVVLLVACLDLLFWDWRTHKRNRSRPAVRI